MQSRRSQENGRAARQPSRNPQYPELANLLDHDAEPHLAGSISQRSVHRTGPIPARRAVARQGCATTNAVSRSQCAETGTPRRLSCPHSRPTTRQYRHLEKLIATGGHQTWNHDWSSTELWVIEGNSGRLQLSGRLAGQVYSEERFGSCPPSRASTSRIRSQKGNNSET